ncbi:hypothetical protein ASG12_00870 [Williamsia sp. Leaf354]|uniref:septum formation family protein n=1 Tax=Williamsia sp. Leaf354 TaxID=1736349 RepID=UPI0006FACF65|nr:septum formation family protein [Williamsia sp. Leaf354]KQR99421.1 hypothetical protein ASG12_00870 [Williamsia sp. Leaf354]
MSAPTDPPAPDDSPSDDTPHDPVDETASAEDAAPDDDPQTVETAVHEDSDPVPEPEDARDSADTTAAGPAAGRTRWLTAHPMRTVLGAVVLGALAAAAIVAAIGGFSDAGSIDQTAIGAEARGPQANAFNRSTPGTCLTWPQNDPSRPSAIGCGGSHYFEVAGVVDLTAAAANTFGDTAPWPSREQFVALREQYCPNEVNSYLNGRFDPNGRFSVGMLYPSQRQWNDGERTLRCGIQSADSTGRLQPFLGRVADLDQAPQWPIGTCIGINQQSRQPTDPVNCAEQHAFQVTGLVGLAEQFGAPGAGKPWPDIATQNRFLSGVCPKMTTGFFGTQKALTDTTLNVQWSTISQVSWLSGSRTAVCYVGLPDRGGFATLVGDGKPNLLINGKVPVPPPVEPPGRLNPTPVPLPQGISPNPTEVPAPEG